MQTWRQFAEKSFNFYEILARICLEYAESCLITSNGVFNALC